MYNEALKNEVHNMFVELTKKAEEITETSRTAQMATERISAMVASRVSTESGGYIVDMYTYHVAKIKEDDFFKDPEHLRAFYQLNLREELTAKYHFEIESLEAYKEGIVFEEVNSLYSAAAVATGTLAVGGILKFAISKSVNVPIAAIIAGAVATGVAVYFTSQQRSKKEYNRAVSKYLDDLEREIVDWLTKIEDFFGRQVSTLYRN